MPLSGSLDWPLDFALSDGSGQAVPWGVGDVQIAFDYDLDFGLN